DGSGFRGRVRLVGGFTVDDGDEHDPSLAHQVEVVLLQTRALHQQHLTTPVHHGLGEDVADTHAMGGDLPGHVRLRWASPRISSPPIMQGADRGTPGTSAPPTVSLSAMWTTGAGKSC